MTKVLLSILIFILAQFVFIQTAPITFDENEDIINTLARLHQETDRIRRRLNPMPDLITFASNDVADRIKRNGHTKTYEPESDTVYVDLKVDSEEELGTEYVNLYIDTRRDVNARYTKLHGVSNNINDKIIYLNVRSTLKNEPLPQYRHFRRHRRNK